MSKISRYIFLLALLLTCTLCASAQNLAPIPFADSAWTKPYEPFRIAGNLYYVGTYDLGCYLIATPQGHILINSGLAQSVPLIKKNVEALGFKFNDIKILLTSQAHFDHVAGMAEIKKITGAKMFVHEKDAKVLGDGGDSDFIFGGKGSTFVPVKADRLLRDGDVIEIGDTKLITIHHPGHTQGSTSFLMDTKDDKRSWKVLIANMPTLQPQTNVLEKESYPGIGKDYEYTFESLKGLQFDLWVTAHASQFNLHRKRKVGDPYHPEAFDDRPGYDNLVSRLKYQYDRRAKKTEK